MNQGFSALQPSGSTSGLTLSNTLFGPCPLPYFSLCTCPSDAPATLPLPSSLYQVPLSCSRHPTALTVVMAWDPLFLSQLLASSCLVQRKFTSLFATYLAPERGSESGGFFSPACCFITAEYIVGILLLLLFLIISFI